MTTTERLLTNERPHHRIPQSVVIVCLGVGCWLILQPFLPAIFFSAVICISTWPAYEKLLTRLGVSAGFASALLCLIVCAFLLLPATFIVVALVDGFHWLLALLEEWIAAGAPEPAWVLHWPVTQAVWQYLVPAPGESMLTRLLAEYSDPTRTAIVAGGQLLLGAATQSTMTIILLFFFYRFGSVLGDTAQSLVAELGGRYGTELLGRAHATVIGVAVGTIGSGLFQAMVAGIGFLIAGVPHPLLFAALTFIVSLLPFGPPLIWSGVALWLLWQVGAGWALFMFIYGGLAISSIDNVVKPLLISRTAHIPFIVTLLGILGGLSAFGMAGLFIGPVLLSLAVEIVKHHRLHLNSTLHPFKSAPAIANTSPQVPRA